MQLLKINCHICSVYGSIITFIYTYNFEQVITREHWQSNWCANRTPSSHRANANGKKKFDPNLDLLTSRSVHGMVLSCTKGPPSLVLTAPAIFLSEHGQTDRQTDRLRGRQTDTTECSIPRQCMINRSDGISVLVTENQKGAASLCWQLLILISFSLH